jgi:cytochrome c oxidase subunit 4
MSDHAQHDHAQHADHDGHNHEGHGGTGIYIAIFVALCVLTTFSFLTYFDFWRNHVPIEISRAFMMAVSCTKAMLVIMFFMHLKWEANWKWVLTVPASIMSALLILALVPDVGLRMRHASYERLRFSSEEPAAVDKLEDIVEKPGDADGAAKIKTDRPAA